MNMKTILAPACYIAFTAWILQGCGTAPYTGRQQLLLISEAEESQLGLQAWTEEVMPSPVSKHPEWTAMVTRVGKRISAVAERPDFQWEFRVIAEPTVNAFCLPGGKVAFYEGIMPVCQDDTGVAVVMGHEVGHAIARHGGERISQSIVAKAGTGVVAKILGGQDPDNQAMVAKALGVGANVGILLPFSRKQESEADHIGLLLMAKAGYDPRAAPLFWERMMAQGGERGPEFLSTHPDPANRIEQLKAWLPEALPHYEASRPAGH
jgi:predicted Zn-dependent protease